MVGNRSERHGTHQYRSSILQLNDGYELKETDRNHAKRLFGNMNVVRFVDSARKKNHAEHGRQNRANDSRGKRQRAAILHLEPVK